MQEQPAVRQADHRHATPDVADDEGQRAGRDPELGSQGLERLGHERTFAPAALQRHGRKAARSCVTAVTRRRCRGRRERYEPGACG